MPKEQVTLIPGTPETKTPERSGPPRLSLALDQETYDQLEKWAEEDERSVSLYTTRLLRVYVAEKIKLLKEMQQGENVVGHDYPVVGSFSKAAGMVEKVVGPSFSPEPKMYSEAFKEVR